MRRAIAALAERGLVRAERGSGTFIEQRRIPYPIKPRTRFSEIVGGAGYTVSGRLTASAVEPADAEIARRLKLKPGAPVMRLELLRHADRVPVCAATTWLDGAALSQRRGFLRVEQFDHADAGALRHPQLRAEKHARGGDDCGSGRRRAAAIAVGRPLLMVDSVDVDDGGVPILTSRARFAADRLELVIET